MECFRIKDYPSDYFLKTGITDLVRNNFLRKGIDLLFDNTGTNVPVTEGYKLDLVENAESTPIRIFIRLLNTTTSEIKEYVTFIYKDNLYVPIRNTEGIKVMNYPLWYFETKPELKRNLIKEKFNQRGFNLVFPNEVEYSSNFKLKCNIEIVANPEGVTVNVLEPVTFKHIISAEIKLSEWTENTTVEEKTQDVITSTMQTENTLKELMVTIKEAVFNQHGILKLNITDDNNCMEITLNKNNVEYHSKTELVISTKELNVCKMVDIIYNALFNECARLFPKNKVTLINARTSVDDNINYVLVETNIPTIFRLINVHNTDIEDVLIDVTDNIISDVLDRKIVLKGAK